MNFSPTLYNANATAAIIVFSRVEPTIYILVNAELRVFCDVQQHICNGAKIRVGCESIENTPGATYRVKPARNI